MRAESSLSIPQGQSLQVFHANTSLPESEAESCTLGMVLEASAIPPRL